MLNSAQHAYSRLGKSNHTIVRFKGKPQYVLHFFARAKCMSQFSSHLQSLSGVLLLLVWGYGIHHTVYSVL